MLSLHDVHDILTQAGYQDIKPVTKTTKLAILTDEDRRQILSNVHDLFKPYGGIWSRETKLSSLGHIQIGKRFVYAKPASRQGQKSSGLMNENIFIESLNQKITEADGCATISFNSNGKQFTIDDVCEAQSVGADTKNRKKSDVNLILATGGFVPISLKKSNAEVWESADRSWGPTAKIVIDSLLDRGEVEIKPHPKKEGVMRIYPEVAIEATDEERMSVMFGSDILEHNGAVVAKTFFGDEITYDGSCVNVEVDSIITSIEDVRGKEDDVVYLIRNDSTRNVKSIGIRGIRPLAVFRSRMKPGKQVLFDRELT